jgi:hypothetical protein
MRRADFLAALGEGVGRTPTVTWVGADFLLSHGVQPWDGPRSLPLWLPAEEYAGFLSRDVTPSLEAGLRIRPLAETARDTAAWLAAGHAPVVDEHTPGGRPVGLTPAEESELLRAWHDRSAG